MFKLSMVPNALVTILRSGKVFMQGVLNVCQLNIFKRVCIIVTLRALKPIRYFRLPNLVRLRTKRLQESWVKPRLVERLAHLLFTPILIDRVA